MISLEQMALILEALPDPAFILSRHGKYIAVYGGRDSRYYHDGSGLVGLYVSDLMRPEKAGWFLRQIARALDSQQLLVEEYELSNRDVNGLPDVGPQEPIWFEGRIQALNFLVDGDEVVLWVASNISERHLLELRLRELSETDQLTGLFNRRRLEHDLTQHYKSAERYAAPTSVVMFDLDGLKNINDSQGHHVGDEVIRTVAQTCRAALRATDSACRLGGDEFVIALPNTNTEQAMQFAVRLRVLFRKALARFARQGAAVTASMGVATIVAEDQTYQDTLKRADAALYTAKSRGKDRIVAA